MDRIWPIVYFVVCGLPPTDGCSHLDEDKRGRPPSCAGKLTVVHKADLAGRRGEGNFRRGQLSERSTDFSGGFDTTASRTNLWEGRDPPSPNPLSRAAIQRGGPPRAPGLELLEEADHVVVDVREGDLVPRQRQQQPDGGGGH